MHRFTFAVPADATWYRGSGQAVGALENGVVVDAIYSGINVEREHRRIMAEKHPNARIVAGMLSSYEFTLFDPSELSQ